MVAPPDVYAARLQIDYPARLDRLTTLLRPFWVVPIAIIFALLASGGGANAGTNGIRITGGLAAATALMIVFRQRYPRWWFEFARELTRFATRVAAYVMLVTDRYPSTVEEQSVHLEIDYPDVRALNRWLPLVKWLLAIPHYIVLAVLMVVAFFGVVTAWFAIMLTGQYPRRIFIFVVGLARWVLRVHAYAFLLVTDRYPPFTMD